MSKLVFRRIDWELYDVITKFQNEFYKENGIKLSFPKATRILGMRLKNNNVNIIFKKDKNNNIKDLKFGYYYG